MLNRAAVCWRGAMQSSTVLCPKVGHAAPVTSSDAILRNIASAPRVRIAVHFSSVAVYGSCVDPRINSFERPRPTSQYGIEKLRSEKIAARLFSDRGIRHYILRLGHVYGPSQQLSFDVLSRTSDPSFSLPFGGDIPSNAVSIHAVIHAIRGMLKDTQPTGVRNLVDTPQSSWREIYDYHTELLGRPAAPSIIGCRVEGLAVALFRGSTCADPHCAACCARDPSICRFFSAGSAHRVSPHGARPPVVGALLDRAGRPTGISRNGRPQQRCDSWRAASLRPHVCALRLCRARRSIRFTRRDAAAAMSDEMRAWLTCDVVVPLGAGRLGYRPANAALARTHRSQRAAAEIFDARYLKRA